MPPHVNLLPLIHMGQSIVTVGVVFVGLIFVTGFAVIGSTWFALIRYVMRFMRRPRPVRAVVVSDIIEGAWRVVPDPALHQHSYTEYPPA